jgi:hypothetical protein
VILIYYYYILLLYYYSYIYRLILKATVYVYDEKKITTSLSWRNVDTVESNREYPLVFISHKHPEIGI